ncbi:MAG: CBS domain-containing protein [Jatrophihabitans sp.]|uniref:CBS domain-containing protein n=1 Tax=Jatrophihabitans sp. TaxID=1932789 RepID=UPI003F7DD9DC
MRISDIVRHKGPAVFTLSRTDTVATLVAALAEHNVGAIVVVDEQGGGRPAGIVSERDVVRQLAADGADLLGRPLGDLMTTDVLTCSLGDSVDSVAETMTQRRVRHMPVLADDGGGLAGVVSIGDVVAYRIRQLEQDRGQLEQYITG